MVADSNGDGLQDLVWILSGWDKNYDTWQIGNSKRLTDRVCTAVSTGKGFKSPLARESCPSLKGQTLSLIPFQI